MPRTKNARRPKNEQPYMEESDLLIQDYKRKAHLRILKMEEESKMEIKRFETFVDVTLSRLPTEIRNMTLGELLDIDIDNKKQICNDALLSVDDRLLPSVSKLKKEKRTTKRITAVSDDGYVTEEIVTTHASRIRKGTTLSTTRRTRSSSRNSKMKLSEINDSTVKKPKKEYAKKSMNVDKFKTPANLKSENNAYDLVTPKVKPNTPLNILRRPREGEMVLSMQGSPLLVSTEIQKNIANINVPLGNGNIISLLPEHGLRMSQIPALDSETMQQLKTLKSHIEKVISFK
ncbi:borealin [Colletes gigas]|uniref:borealin n=1 Tax=Colletes gigas TaxID=935657 RepID=UPI001C9A2E6A|nr:borealin [Colletes gigas]